MLLDYAGYWLISYRCGAIPSLIEEVLLHSQDTSALKAANTLLRTISSDANFQDKMTSMRPLIDALHEMGFTGLWRFSSQDLGEEIRRECFDLTERLIEVRFSYILREKRKLLIFTVNNYLNNIENIYILEIKLYYI